MLFLPDEAKFIQLLPPSEDALSGSVTTDVVSLIDYNKGLFLIELGDGATGQSTITLESSAANDGADPTALPFRYKTSDADGTNLSDWQEATVAGAATPTGGNKLMLIEARTDALPSGKPWVHLKGVESVDSPVAASILAILYAGRYQGDLPDAV